MVLVSIISPPLFSVYIISHFFPVSILYWV
nr:MAG TPA: hypothetical protein [Caudoviricetes sp.]